MTLRNRFFFTFLLTVHLLFSTVSGENPDTAYSTSQQAPYLRLIRPNGGEILFKGDNTTITWTSRGIESGGIILVLYFKGIKHMVLSENCPDTGRFEWRIPEDVSPGMNYRIRIRWSTRPEVNDFSDADFRIAEKPIQ